MGRGDSMPARHVAIAFASYIPIHTGKALEAPSSLRRRIGLLFLGSIARPWMLTGFSINSPSLRSSGWSWSLRA